METARPTGGTGGDAIDAASLPYQESHRTATAALAEALADWRGHKAQAARIEAVARGLDACGTPAAHREAERQRAWARRYADEALELAAAAILAARLGGAS